MRLEIQTERKIIEAMCDRITTAQKIDTLNRHRPVERIKQSKPNFKGKTYLEAASNVRSHEDSELIALAKMGQAAIALKRRMLDYEAIIQKHTGVKK